VRRLARLRVADGSIMPTMVEANPSVTITLIGSKAASLITGVRPGVAEDPATLGPPDPARGGALTVGVAIVRIAHHDG
jgi:choline dehydrogenase-like flavoprotein